jgi:hypothetical protein
MSRDTSLLFADATISSLALRSLIRFFGTFTLSVGALLVETAANYTGKMVTGRARTGSVE